MATAIVSSIAQDSEVGAIVFSPYINCDGDAYILPIGTTQRCTTRGFSDEVREFWSAHTSHSFPIASRFFVLLSSLSLPYTHIKKRKRSAM